MESRGNLEIKAWLAILCGSQPVIKTDILFGYHFKVIKHLIGAYCNFIFIVIKQFIGLGLGHLHLGFILHIIYMSHIALSCPHAKQHIVICVRFHWHAVILCLRGKKGIPVDTSLQIIFHVLYPFPNLLIITILFLYCI